MEIRVYESLNKVSAAQWNALVKDNNPFLSHEFLSALENNNCIGERCGWLPHYLLCSADDGTLLGACPLYIKDNSYGEFVFDWSWADAYHRHGLDYYPKLVNAIPFTPATGQRLLVADGAEQAMIAGRLIEAAVGEAKRLNCSSLHCLFASETDLTHYSDADFLTRLGCHFHWHNQDYRHFSDFIQALTSKKRKNINRERRLVSTAGIRLRTLSGCEASEAEWHNFYRFYRNTFLERGRTSPLTLDFFLEIAQTLGRQIVLVLAAKDGVDVAGAISFRSDTVLFGRHWGCRRDYDSLHFECCYYQGIEYCIDHRLQRFEPGVQGEHKIWRGFLPTLTRSAHWLAHPAFHEAVGEFLNRETPAVRAYAEQLKREHSPYKQHNASVSS